MNTLGKILMGLLLVCLLFATYLTTGALKARSSWLKKVGDKSAQIEQAEKDLASNKKLFEDARNLVHWENDTWGRAWQAPNSSPSPTGDGSFEFGIGSNAGLARGQTDPAKLPIVYLFATEAGSPPKYIGDFQLTEVRQDSAGGKLTRPPYADEIQGWPTGEYRIREQVPHDYLNTINDLRTQLILADQTVAHEQAMLKIQTEHVTASQTALDQRLTELNGKPDATEKAGLDVKEGLVQTLRREETSRNTLVGDVDQLRRELSDKHLLLTNILTGNLNQVQSVSVGSGTKTSTKRVAAQKPADKNN